MLVEAAMRQASSLHDVGEADTVKTLLAEQRSRHVEDALTGFGGLLPADSHRTSAPHAPLTAYMMTDIYACKIDVVYHLNAWQSRASKRAGPMRYGLFGQ